MNTVRYVPHAAGFKGRGHLSGWVVRKDILAEIGAC